MSEQIVKYSDGLPLVHVIQGKRMMLDSDLARIYGVSTTRLNEQFKRNKDRFPKNFAFQLTRQQVTGLISQSAISKKGRGGRQKLPWAFTEHGAVMLACILRSPIAVEASVRVVNAFFYMREQMTANIELAKKLTDLEKRLDGHDQSIADLFGAIRQLLEPETSDKDPEMGFHVREEAMKYWTHNGN